MPPRKKPMPKGAAQLRRTPIKPVNRARKATTFERAFGGKARVLFVKGLPCVVPGCTARDVQNAHSEIGGTGYRANADTIVPLCSRHHGEQEGRTDAFEYRHGLPAGFLAVAAAETEAMWQAHLATL